MAESEFVVLVVEDDDATRCAMVRVLATAGYCVEEAADGEQALEFLQGGRRFDTIVTDLHLPGVRDTELLRQVRDAEPHAPLVVVTGAPSIETAVAAVELGSFRYLIKPVGNDVLRETVHSAITANRLAILKRQATQPRDRMEPGEQSELDAVLSHAMAGLWMAFQPIVDWPRRKVYGFEALVRCSEAAFPHPGALFDAAERLGRLHELGRVIRALVAVRLSDAPPGVLVFVNLHPADLGDEELYSRASPLTKHADRIVLEITERSSLEQVTDVKGRIAALRQLGFGIAVDDLGAGYSGLASFGQLEPDGVKLDMSLVRDADTSPYKRKIVKSMISACSTDPYTYVVCEGVETHAERDALTELGAELLQGYLFGRPERDFRDPFTTKAASSSREALLEDGGRSMMSHDDDTTEILRRISLRPREIVARLTVLSGCSIGQVFRIEQSTAAIGRAPSCDIRIDDDGGSRRHAKICKRDEGLTLVDCGSTNGTFVNGQRIQSKLLKDGDMIQVGARTVFKFTLRDELEGLVQEQLYNASVRDALTQTYNRRFFDEELNRAVSDAVRRGLALSLLLIDLDHFKSVNDELGHPAGDRVLVEVVKVCLETIRPEDLLCRVGGEEFAVIARGASAEDAATAAEQLRRRIASTPIRVDNRDLAITVSVGVAGLDTLADKSTDALFQAADHLLYRAKSTGRNVVCGARSHRPSRPATPELLRTREILRQF